MAKKSKKNEVKSKRITIKIIAGIVLAQAAIIFSTVIITCQVVAPEKEIFINPIAKPVTVSAGMGRTEETGSKKPGEATSVAETIDSEKETNIQNSGGNNVLSSSDKKSEETNGSVYGPKEASVPKIFSDLNLQKKLEDVAKNDKDVFYIATHIEDYQPEILEVVLNEPAMAGFVKDLPTAEKKPSGYITIEELEAEYPLFVQWDKRWGYVEYGDGNIARCGCAPTALSMVIVGLTKDKDATPDAVADYCMENNLYVNGSGTDWSLFTRFLSPYGLSGKILLFSKENMIRALDQGHPIVISLGPGDFTQTGHIAVVTGYENGKFKINDPGSIIRSERLWSFEELIPQIKQLWEIKKL